MLSIPILSGEHMLLNEGMFESATLNIFRPFDNVTKKHIS